MEKVLRGISAWTQNLFAAPDYCESLDGGRRSRKYLLTAFFGAAVISAIMLLPIVIVGEGYFLYYGDYNVQQIPFYRHAVELVRSGNLFWDWQTDLGSSFLGNYAFYLSGSPFFWLMCLFPSSWTPYLMAPMYVIKFATASLFAYMYLKRFVKSPRIALLGGLMYAFSGFQVYNVFFNHFHDAVAFFPLMLIGIEEAIQNNRRVLFAFSVALCCCVNYVFFVGNAFFCVIYFFMRCATKSFNITWKKFFLLAFEAVLGVLLSGIIMFPAVTALIGNYRLDRSFSTLKQALVYLKSGKPYTMRYGHILQSFFFPPDVPSRVNFFYGHTERWASNAAWIPLFGMSGPIAYFFAKRKASLKFLFGFLFVSAFVPILNSIYVMGNTSYYARWMYMPVLIGILMTIIVLDDPKISLKPGIIINAAVCAAVAVPLGFLWYKDPDNTSSVVYQMTRAIKEDRFWVSVTIAFVCIIVAHLLVKYLRGTKFFERATALVLVATILTYGIIHLSWGRSHGSSTSSMRNTALEAVVELEDDEFYRIDFFRDSSTSSLDNLGLYWGYSSLQFFNSSVAPSILTFYPKLDITRNVASRPNSSYYGLRSLLSAKYSFISKSKTNKQADVPGWTYYDTQNGFDIYINDNFLPMGFTYTEFMTETQFEKISKSDRHLVSCRYLVVPDEMEEYYSQFMTCVTYGNYITDLLNEQSFTQSVNDRRADGLCENFEYGTTGFSANITLEKSNVVFFSVPYEKPTFEFLGLEIPLGGWSATVNGKSVDVNVAYYGLMCVECEAGENEIVFSYNMPGFVLGIATTFVSALILAVYIYISRKACEKGKLPAPRAEYYDDGI